jgi:predicted DCC family thiol-disulfide oxidoreductase YuxK
MNSSEGSGAISVLLYDGQCAFCNWAVGLVLAHEKASSLRFASLTSEVAQHVVDQYPELQEVDSVIWVDLDEVGTPTGMAIRSAAVIRIFRYLGGWWSIFRVAWIIPRPLRDKIYDLVARNRRRILNSSSGRVNPADNKWRFLR